MNNIISKNTILIIICVFSIISILLMYRNYTKEKIIIDQPESFKRTNPVPLFNPTMDFDAKYYESIPALQKKNVKIILCHANWCAHCRKMLPKFQQLKDTNTLSNIEYIIVEEQDKTNNIKYHNIIEFYPTILIDIEGKIQQYSGPTTKTAIIKYVNSL